MEIVGSWWLTHESKPAANMGQSCYEVTPLGRLPYKLMMHPMGESPGVVTYAIRCSLHHAVLCCILFIISIPRRIQHWTGDDDDKETTVIGWRSLVSRRYFSRTNLQPNDCWWEVSSYLKFTVDERANHLPSTVPTATGNSIEVVLHRWNSCPGYNITLRSARTTGSSRHMLALPTSTPGSCCGFSKMCPGSWCRV